MKKIINLLIIGLFLSFTSAKKVSLEKDFKFKMIAQASYSPKRSGELTREEALKKNIERKEIYNPEGFLIEYWKYEIDGTIYQKTKLTKNGNGKLLKSTIYNNKNELKSYTTTIFNQHKNIVKYNTYNSDGTLDSFQENDYDDNGNIVSITSKLIKSNRVFKTTKRYNPKNQVIKQATYKPNGDIRYIRTFVYDEKGNEIESEMTRPNGDYTKFVSTYDERNNILTQYWYDKNGKQKHWNNWIYSYDKNDNWITKKRYSKGELGFVWERIIEYY